MRERAHLALREPDRRQHGLQLVGEHVGPRADVRARETVVCLHGRSVVERFIDTRFDSRLQPEKGRMG